MAGLFKKNVKKKKQNNCKKMKEASRQSSWIHKIKKCKASSQKLDAA